jgi:hypothetical protein
MSWTRFFALAGLLALTTSSVRAEDPKNLTLDDFLGQVKSQGNGYRSASQAVEGLGKQKVQTDLACTLRKSWRTGRARMTESNKACRSFTATAT